MQEKYQVFISFKSKDEAGATTWDAVWGEKLYEALEARGIKTFFSPKSVVREAISDYAKLIYEVLEEADILVAMCSRPEYLSDGWVREEVATFKNELLSGHKDKCKSGLYVFREKQVRENEMPIYVRANQMYSVLNEIVDVIERRLNGAEDVRKNMENHTVVLKEQWEAMQKAETLSEAADRTLQPGEVLLGKYEVVKAIGRGGMADIYEVKDQTSGESYALKRLRMMGNMKADVACEAMLTEVKMMQQLQSEHVPRIHAVDYLADGSLCIVMDLVRGKSLRDIVRNAGPLSPEKVMDVAMQLCEVLDTMHAMKPAVIYRDMKPANVMMDETGGVTLLDFGAARYYKEKYEDDNEANVDTVCLGTIGYAAPEQFGGLGQTDPRADIYGLGMTLYYLLTGQDPKLGVDLNTIYDALKDISEPLACVIEHCTEPDREKRYATMAQLRQDLEHPDGVLRQPRIVYHSPMAPAIRPLMSDDVREITCILTENPDYVPQAVGTPMALTEHNPIFSLKKAAPAAVSMRLLVCVSNAYLKNRTQYVHVYVAEEEHTELLEKIPLLHLDYEKSILSDVFAVPEGGTVTVDVQGKHTTFDSPKSMICEEMNYLCFKSVAFKKKATKEKIKVTITADGQTLMQLEMKLTAIDDMKKG